MYKVQFINFRTFSKVCCHNNFRLHINEPKIAGQLFLHSKLYLLLLWKTFAYVPYFISQKRWYFSRKGVYYDSKHRITEQVDSTKNCSELWREATIPLRFIITLQCAQGEHICTVPLGARNKQSLYQHLWCSAAGSLQKSSCIMIAHQSQLLGNWLPPMQMREINHDP